MRDEYEAKIDDLKERLQKALHEDYNLSVDPLAFFPYTEAENRQNQLGYCIYTYFDNAITALERLTDNGKDTESSALINKYVEKKTLVIVPEVIFNYCGMDIKDGEIRVIFHPEKLLYNVSDVGSRFASKLDVGTCLLRVLMLFLPLLIEEL